MQIIFIWNKNDRTNQELIEEIHYLNQKIKELERSAWPYGMSPSDENIDKYTCR
ncbi:MAG: hypothetical protein PHN98_01460 [Smithellaceae bacterium]|nr:hypothetical protein [Smithellaceae bacterium]